MNYFVLCIILSCVLDIQCQFPNVCNNEVNITSKICCPDKCGESYNGVCTNITEQAIESWEKSDPEIVSIIRNSINFTGKESVDFRYRWPTVVFEKVCICKGNFFGFNCSDCYFGYTGKKCSRKKPPIMRKSFGRLNLKDKINLTKGYFLLKNEYSRWSVVVAEPRTYSGADRVTLQNVSTYDMFVYLHALVNRDGPCKTIGSNKTIDFAHQGPVFPMWHRHYVLLLEKEMQRVLADESFALPYWRWDNNEMDMFTEEYLGFPSTESNQTINVSSPFHNKVWPTVCDILYRKPGVKCEEGWKLCNPEQDRNANRPLQRGKNPESPYASAYLPTLEEVMIANSAPSYDASDDESNYGVHSPRASYRNRLEGWTRICSATNCVGPLREPHMHNLVHLWVGGQMAVVPSAVNDPIFFLHHCNVDRALESWIRRFVGKSSNPLLLPGYTPAHGGHPGHNKADWMVPFFPLVKPIDYYNSSDVFGYVYDEIFENNIQDSTLTMCDPEKECVEMCFI